MLLYWLMCLPRPHHEIILIYFVSCSVLGFSFMRSNMTKLLHCVCVVQNEMIEYIVCLSYIQIQRCRDVINYTLFCTYRNKVNFKIKMQFIINAIFIINYCDLWILWGN